VRIYLDTSDLLADALVTYDRADFQSLLGKSVYGLRIALPGDILRPN